MSKLIPWEWTREREYRVAIELACSSLGARVLHLPSDPAAQMNLVISGVLMKVISGVPALSQIPQADIDGCFLTQSIEFLDRHCELNFDSSIIVESGFLSISSGDGHRFVWPIVRAWADGDIVTMSASELDLDEDYMADRVLLNCVLKEACTLEE